MNFEKPNLNQVEKNESVPLKEKLSRIMKAGALSVMVSGPAVAETEAHFQTPETQISTTETQPLNTEKGQLSATDKEGIIWTLSDVFSEGEKTPDEMLDIWSAMEDLEYYNVIEAERNMRDKWEEFRSAFSSEDNAVYIEAAEHFINSITQFIELAQPVIDQVDANPDLQRVITYMNEMPYFSAVILPDDELRSMVASMQEEIEVVETLVDQRTSR